MENSQQLGSAILIERLKALEYAVRKSMAVREDQDEVAEPQHVEEAQACGIWAEDATTKGDLLGAVQTLVRATQARASAGAGQKE